MSGAERERVSRNKMFLWNETDESSEESLQEKRKGYYSLCYISRRKMKMTVAMRTARRLRTQKEIKGCKAVAEEDN